MRELNHAILGLEEWSKEATCDFCPALGIKAVCQIISRNKVTEKLVAGNCACEDCRDNLDELPRCERCGRLEIRVRFANGKYLCACVRYNEDLEEKELPVLPQERSRFARHEERIGELQEQLNETVWALEAEREEVEKFHEASKKWSERQKKELLDRIKELEAEVNRIKEENERLKALTPQELINKLTAYESEIAKLKEKQVTQIEIKPLSKRPSFPFFRKS